MMGYSDKEDAKKISASFLRSGAHSPLQQNLIMMSQINPTPFHF